MTLRGLKDGAGVLLGKVLFNAVDRHLTSMIPIPALPGGMDGVVKSLITAAAGSFALNFAPKRFVSPDIQRMAIAGMYVGLVSSLAQRFLPAQVTSYLGEYDILAGNYNGLGSYAQPRAITPARGMGSYPQPEFEGEQYAFGG